MIRYKGKPPVQEYGPTIVYQVSHEDLKETIHQTLNDLYHDAIYNRFEGIMVDTKTACKIVKCCPRTLEKYRQLKKIKPGLKVNRNWEYDLKSLLEFKK